VLHVEKRRSYVPVTTRKYDSGEHGIEPKINGQLFDRVAFILR
jgi:hypothetical protein